MTQHLPSHEIQPRLAKVAALQMRSLSQDKQANLAMAEQLIRTADADLVVLPELFATEFFASRKDLDAFNYAEPEDGFIIATLSRIARSTRTVIVAPFYEYHPSGIYYNSAALIDTKGDTLGIYRKTHIPFTQTYEKFYFAAGREFPVFDTSLGRIGILICYDRWFPEAWRSLRDAGAEIVCIPIASWRYQGYSEASWWNALHQMRARENQLFLIAANKTGREGDFDYIGRSQIVSPLGDVCAEADETENHILVASIDVNEVRHARAAFPLLRDRRPDIY